VASQIAAAFRALLETSIPTLLQTNYITQEQWNTVNNELQAARAIYNSRNSELNGQIKDAFSKLPESDPEYKKLDTFYAIILQYITKQRYINDEIKKSLAMLATHIKG
jgi:GTP1/Obg family GTP-binding protein